MNMHIDLDRISFAEWLIELNDCAVKSGYKSHQSFVQSTGQLCWYPNYEAGMSPEEALEQARKDGTEFGEDYCLI